MHATWRHSSSGREPCTAANWWHRHYLGPKTRHASGIYTMQHTHSVNRRISERMTDVVLFNDHHTVIHMTVCDQAKRFSSTTSSDRQNRSCFSTKACTILRQVILRQLKFEHIAALHKRCLSHSHLATYAIPPSSAAAEVIFGSPNLRMYFGKYSQHQVAEAARKWLWALACDKSAGAPERLQSTHTSGSLSP